MKFTLSWLKDHLDTKLELKEIIEKLTNIGLEVESITDKSKELELFTVAKVLKAEKHPNADRLKVCMVETNKGKFQVICGAPNAREGMKGIFAPEGSYIPGTGIKLKKTDIRGVSSAGMLLSEKELGISEDHEGIIEVDISYKVGESFSKIFGLDDPIIEIGITPNRSDCLSVRGIARDLAATGFGKLRDLEVVYKGGKVQDNFESPIKWKIDLNKFKLYCPAVAGIYFKNVKNQSSPDWLKKRLIAIGLRPISALVDITNYITFDLGRPLHVFDADKINGDLKMRLAKKNENIKALDGKLYNLSEEMVVIADNNQSHAIGGVMGGEESSCSEKTTNVFLEIALFDPINIAKTGRKLNLQSDARYRFERGIDPYSIEWGIDIAIKLIIKLCGGESSKITLAGDYKFPPKIIEYNFSKVKNLGGTEIDIDIQKTILNRLGFELNNKTTNKSLIKVPSHRPDIVGEADLVQEILTIHVYDNIKPIKVVRNQYDNLRPLNLKQLTSYQSKRLIASRGYFEVVTWSFMSSKYAKYFNYYKNILKIDNPISNDLDVMRPSIIPNLLDSIQKNQGRLLNNAGIFEVGPQYENFKKEGQHNMASGIKYGTVYFDNWNEEKRFIDVFDIKSDIFNLLSSFGISIEKLGFEYKAPSWYHPGKSCVIKLGKEILGFFGDINPIILNVYGITTNVCAFEVFLDKLSVYRKKTNSIKSSFKSNPYQAVERDFAFILNNNIQSSEIINSIKKAEKELIRDLYIFDVYQGKNIPEGKKSIAIKIILQPIKSTFTDEEIEQICNKIINNVKNDIGGEIRK